MAVWGFFVVFLFLKYVVTVPSSECEPVSCDGPLLNKMIEMGHKVQELGNYMRKIEEYLLSVLVYRREEVDKLSGDCKSELGKVREDLKLLKDRQDRADVAKVAFSAHSPSDNSLQTNEVLILKTVLINEGNGYDTTTGVFTSPVGGLYLFTAHVCNTVKFVIHYAITLNGEWIAASQQFEENDVNSYYGSCSSVSALTMMEPGDKVQIMCTSGYTSAKQIFDDKYRRNTFLGVLLHK